MKTTSFLIILGALACGKPADAARLSAKKLTQRIERCMQRAGYAGPWHVDLYKYVAKNNTSGWLADGPGPRRGFVYQEVGRIDRRTGKITFLNGAKKPAPIVMGGGSR
jgi:hypothetical protein